MLMHFKPTYIVFLLISIFAFSASAKTIDIALVRDGPADAFLTKIQVKKEIEDLLGDEFSINFVDSGRTDADWTLQGVNRVLSGLYADKTTDLIIAIGPISSNEVGKLKSLRKPTIAATIINPLAQSLPIEDNKSGRNNFAYIADLNNAGGEIGFFSEFVGKKKYTVLVEPFLSESWKELPLLLSMAEKEYGIQFQQVTLTKDLNQVRQSIAADTQAVMVGVLSQHNEQEIKELANLLIEMKLPSYTFLGEKGVDAGFMVTDGQVEQARFQISRRIAVNVQRILLGRNAKDLPVNINFNNRVIYNEATGLQIGFAPSWQKIISAKVIHRDERANRRAFTVTQAIAHAIENNLSLQANSINVDLADKDRRLAKSNLYPRLSLDGNYQQIKQSQAFVGNPEKRSDLSLNLSQSIYSESNWANYDISDALFRGQNELYQAAILDTAQQAASAYLNLLSAKANEEIRLSNLELTEKNLELAENRFRIGSSGKSDVLRFKSQVATDRQNLFSAVASRNGAELELARVMNLPDGVLVDVREPGVSSLLTILTGARFNTYVSNQIHWNAFQDFYKLEAVANAPELKSFNAQLEANERDIIANQRGYYIPDVNLNVTAGRNLSQSGIGALDNAEQNSWTVGLGATLPIDLSGQRRITISRRKLEKNQINLNRLSTQQKIISNTGKSLHNIGSSFPSIQLSKEASEAALESLDLVQDSYAKGVVSISDLLDAQNTVLSARLASVNAEYAFLQDYMGLMRAAGDFKPILNGRYSSQWFDRLHKYFKERNIEVLPRKEL